MAYVTPTARAAGYVVPETTWNQDVVDNVIALRGGAVAQPSQTAGDVVIAASSTQLGRVASPSDATQFLIGAATPTFALVKDSDLSTSDVTTNNASTTKHGFLKKLSNVSTEFMNGVGDWVSIAGSPITLLKSGSGTDTTATATVVDSIAITGLTALDTLKVEVTMSSATQATSAGSLYSVTDSVAVYPIFGGGSMALNVFNTESATLRQDFSSATKVVSCGVYYTTAIGGQPSGNSANTTTNWTGSWTLGLRHGGVTAGGTLRWSWAVYLVKGQ